MTRLLLHAASLLAPSDRRAAWRREWRAELWYIDPARRTAACLGAFRDALWLRHHQPSATPLQSPLDCLAALATLAAACLCLTLMLPAPHTLGTTRLHVRELPDGVAAMLLLTTLLLPATRVAMGPATIQPHQLSVTARLRNALFFAVKVALVQPVLLCGFVLAIPLTNLLPVAPQLAVCASWIFAFRWVLDDQRRRCPVCLRRLGAAVRIGSVSKTFLEWYGAESICPREHGLLQLADLTADYAATSHWRPLDASWTLPAKGPR